MTENENKTNKWFKGKNIFTLKKKSTAKHRECREDFHNQFSITYNKLCFGSTGFSFATDGKLRIYRHRTLSAWTLWLIAEILHALCMPRHLEKGSDSVPYALTSSQHIPSFASALCLLVLCIQKSGLPFHSFYFLLAICLIIFWKTLINCVSRCY